MTPRPRQIMPDARVRDTLIAVVIGAAILGLIIYAVVDFAHQNSATGSAEGVIVSRAFEPAPETQITFGKGGVARQEIAGEYSFQVRVPTEHDRIYKVIVGQADYEARQPGERFRFLRSPPPQ